MAVQEAMRDLEKPIEQLLADIHEQGLKGGAQVYHVTEAIRRMSSMMAKVAISNRQLSEKLVWLTRVLVVLTGALVLLTVALVVTAF